MYNNYRGSRWSRVTTRDSALGNSSPGRAGSSSVAAARPGAHAALMILKKPAASAVGPRPGPSARLVYAARAFFWFLAFSVTQLPEACEMSSTAALEQTKKSGITKEVIRAAPDRYFVIIYLSGCHILMVHCLEDHGRSSMVTKLYLILLDD